MRISIPTKEIIAENVNPSWMLCLLTLSLDIHQWREIFLHLLLSSGDTIRCHTLGTGGIVSGAMRPQLGQNTRLFCSNKLKLWCDIACKISHIVTLIVCVQQEISWHRQADCGVVKYHCSLRDYYSFPIFFMLHIKINNKSPTFTEIQIK